MQIEIDFEVYKALTTLRESETDSYTGVLRRLLNIPANVDQLPNSERASLGAWFGKVHFPEGTQFKAVYKGRAYSAEIGNAGWVDQEGMPRNSPSEAASAVCGGTNVNGWRFWQAKRPGDATWRRIDGFR
ncbi:hypothetical protein ACVWZA_002191 [Sphingomonas sp. UYAg733]